MKRRGIALILALISALLVMTAFKAERDFVITPGDGYIFCYRNDPLDKVTERLNGIYLSGNGESADGRIYDSKSLGEFFDKNNIAFFAVSRKDASQIRVSVYSDSISNGMQDLSVKSDAVVKEFAEDLVSGSDLRYEIFRRDGKKYIMLESTEKDQGGEYTVRQYITVCNGKVFNISFFGSGDRSDSEAVLDTFAVNAESSVSSAPLVNIIFVSVAIALLVCLIVYMAWGLVKRAKIKRGEAETGFVADEEGDKTD